MRVSCKKNVNGAPQFSTVDFVYMSLLDQISLCAQRGNFILGLKDCFTPNPGDTISDITAAEYGECFFNSFEDFKLKHADEGIRYCTVP